jgi:hypothetical protein
VAAKDAAQPQYGEARKAFSAACRPSTGAAPSSFNQDLPKACFELGMLVRDAKGGPKDIPRATELFEMACKADIYRACVDLGALLWSDDPEEKASSDRAAVLFEEECNRVDLQKLPDDGSADPLAEACDRLGRAYETGLGVEPAAKDEDKAAAFYDRACQARYAPGCVSAGNLKVESHRAADVAAAVDYYDRACKLDARQGCFDLGALNEKKAWPGATDQAAVEYYKKSCAIDPMRGCFEAAAMMEEGRVRAGDGEIASLYNQACEHGHTTACERRALKH